MRYMLGSLTLILLTGLAAVRSAAAQDETAWDALRGGGHVGLMRHARAPGTDDPPNFRIGDCTTQRNLSAGGRDQAAAVGERLRAHGIDRARVYSSQWCRCLDTAALIDIGPVDELPFLNSLVSYPRESGTMTRAAREWIAAQDLSGPVVLVTHQVNIGALVQQYPAEGEIVVVRPTAAGGLEVVGTIGVD
jgi:phosphohistidine phosphatase SixA